MQQAEFNKNLLHNLAKAVTPFHAVDLMAGLLRSHGFQQLKETESWSHTLPAGSYFLIHNDSSLITFTLSPDQGTKTGFRMIGAHTDSPCLKVKPNPAICTQSYLQIGVEVYGGALLAPWFDRDLSLAGRVTWQGSKKIHSSLIDFARPVAVIPSLAIHLDREANKKRSINKHKDIIPVLMQISDDREIDFRDLLTEQITRQYPESDISAILSFDLSFHDTQPPAIIGLNQEFITGSRLDDLVSCFTAIQALLDADPNTNCMVILNDHEEVGSISTAGAQGPLVQMIFERLFPAPADRQSSINRSLLLSTDNAHGVHPNAIDKFDQHHGPLLNHGPVVKSNANQRYATNSITAAFFKSLCKRVNIPVQEFVMRSDMVCGSTIGPLTAGKIGVKTVDIGVPSFGMHSIRETIGVKDCHSLYQVFKEFFCLDNESSEFNLLDQ